MTAPPAPLQDFFSLGRSENLDTPADLFRAAAARIAAAIPDLDPQDLFDRMTAPDQHSANLRGPLLLMETPCPRLDRPCALFLLGTAHVVHWHKAPIRLLLIGLYRPAGLPRYLAASRRLYARCLTTDHIRRWLAGTDWPDPLPSPNA
jgi:hypothetical protein